MIRSSLPRHCPAGAAVALALLAGLAAAPSATAQNTAARPRPYALRDVRLSAADDAPRKTILLRAGRIEAIQDAALTVPPDAWVIEADGLVAVPAFVDAWTTTGCEAPEPVVDRDQPASTEANVRIDMRQANRKGLQPAFRSAEVLALSEEDADRHRKAGFGALLCAPGDELLAGSSALASARAAAARDVVVDDRVFQHAAFRASGEGYPSTLMGYHAQLRQFFLDAEHQRVLRARHAAGKPGPRPAFDDDLEAVLPVLDGEQLLACAAESARDVERWLRLADELDLSIGIAGGHDAWKVAERLAERDVPVLLTLDWGDEPKDPDAEPEKEKKKREGEPEEEPDEPDEPEEDADEPTEPPQDPEQEPAAAEEEADPFDYDYREPLDVQREKRRLWLERRDCALRLREAGVRVVFCTGDGKPAELLERVRALVENGFPRADALAALTSQPAELLGADRDFGWLRPGHSANLSLWTDDPLSEGAQVVWSVVDGFPREFEVKDEAQEGDGPEEGVDLSGRWQVTFPEDDDAPEMVLTLTMAEDGALTGSVKTRNPIDESDLFADVTGSVSGRDVKMRAVFSVGGMDVQLELEGELEDDALEGKSTLRLPGSEEENRFEAERLPDDGDRR